MKSFKKGFVIFPFLIALTLVIFFVQSFFTISQTLVYASVAQYISYSSARRLSLGANDINIQKQNSDEKFNELTGRLFKNSSWFTLTKQAQGFDQDYSSVGGGYRRLFYGYSTKFISQIVNFEIPYVSSESPRPFEATISSFLGRAPSKKECENFFDDRAAQICEKLEDCTPADTVRRSDNGC